MKIKYKLITILILLLILIPLLPFLSNNQLKTSTVPITINPTITPDMENKVDYLSINDDDVILKNGRYSQPDNIYQELISTELKEFLVNDYYPTHGYTYPNIKINLDCPLEDSKFFSTEVDLNEDGKKEYLLMPYNVCDTFMRGASGNGDILIIRSVSNTFEVFGKLYGNSYFISKYKTNGYFDILTNSHGSATTGTETLYKYQIYSFGVEGETYEEAFSKWYDLSRIKNKVVEIVKNLPEVKDFLSRMKKLNQKTFIKADRASNSWNVQVAEDHPYNTTTFNWYTIDTATMKAKCSFAIYDKDGELVRVSNSTEYPCD